MKNFTADQIREALNNCSIDYNGNISVDDIAEFLFNEMGQHIKNLLKELGIYDRTKKHKNDNIEHFRYSVTIDGIGTSKVKENVEPTQSQEPIQNSTVDENSDDNIVVLKSIPKNSNESVQDNHFNDTLFNDTQQTTVDKYFMDKPTNILEAQNLYDNPNFNGNIIPLDQISDGNTYFEVSAKNSFYENSSININNNISIQTTLNLDKDFNMLVNPNGKVILKGNFILDNQKYYLEADSKNIDFNSISYSTKFKFIVADSTFTKFYSNPINIKLNQIEVSDKTLCIDFGTSNTTMGTYINNKPELVQFLDTTKSNHENSYLCPTMVYVNKCYPESGKIDYLFGYDAKKVLIDSDYNPDGSLFFEIKRWVTSLDDIEDVTDSYGNTIKIKRSEILKAYLENLIQKANEHFHMRFKKLHFTAPVKLKNKFIKFLQNDVFPMYEVLDASNSLDEGVAIIYNYISNKIKFANDNKSQNGLQKENIMIIDCGGGTTDLASCEYKFTNSPTGYNLDIKTTFENGNSNFGGNNITYEIFQLLKIKLANYYQSQNRNDNLSVSISDLIGSNDNEILNQIDTCIELNKPLDIYDKLNQKSKESEEILPTDFEGSSKYAEGSTSKRQTRRNFYYLWQLAEKIKIQFFTKTDLVTINFNEKDSNIVIENYDNLYFYIKNPNGDIPPLVKVTDVPRIEINTKEISALLRPAIYNLLATIFRINKNIELDLLSYQHVKFSGQSCKISLFQELLKEFIPGKKFRETKRTQEKSNENSAKLKLECINGSILYMMNKETHMIIPNITTDIPNLIYDVKISRGDNINTKYLIKGSEVSKDTNKGYIAPPLDIDVHEVNNGKLFIEVNNIVGEIVKENSFYQDVVINERMPIELDELQEIIENNSYINKYYVKGNTYQNLADRLIEEIRNIEFENNSQGLLVFATPNIDGYGFILYQLIKKISIDGDSYYLTSKTTHTFEGKSYNKSFFNGKNCE